MSTGPLLNVLNILIIYVISDKNVLQYIDNKNVVYNVLIIKMFNKNLWILKKDHNVLQSSVRNLPRNPDPGFPLLIFSLSVFPTSEKL